MSVTNTDLTIHDLTGEESLDLSTFPPELAAMLKRNMDRMREIAIGEDRGPDVRDEYHRLAHEVMEGVMAHLRETPDIPNRDRLLAEGEELNGNLGLLEGISKTLKERGL